MNKITLDVIKTFLIEREFFNEDQLEIISNVLISSFFIITTFNKIEVSFNLKTPATTAAMFATLLTKKFSNVIIYRAHYIHNKEIIWGTDAEELFIKDQIKLYRNKMFDMFLEN